MGTFAIVLSFIFLPVTGAIAATCNNSPGATMDDGACGYINPDDRVFAVLDRIGDVQHEVEGLQIQLAFVTVLLVIIAFASIGQLIVSLSRKTEVKNDESQNREPPASS
ncbi:MAG: hypothetical protein JWN12_476 [Candidatus Saccharibacteria bacterium]|nr:hypothetical protein [Candidatus Saccharibacteria bacterium]